VLAFVELPFTMVYQDDFLAKTGYARDYEFLPEPKEVNDQDDAGETKLYKAAEAGDLDQCKELISKGVCSVEHPPG